jgi:hypothetical protein
MLQLNLPAFEFQVKKIAGKLYIFDVLRKKYVFLTPEEWVRQHFVHFLIHENQYPKSLIKLEAGVHYHTLSQRSDLVVYDAAGKPFLVVECKGAEVALSQEVIEQAARYNHIFKAPYVAITNGLETFCCEIDFENKKLTWSEDVPPWN